MEGQTTILASPNDRIIIRESIVIEKSNSFGGSTSFDKLNITTSEPILSKYRKIHKDDLNRRIVLEEGGQPKGQTMERQAVNFEPTVIYYSFFGNVKNGCELPELVVRTTRNNDQISKREIISSVSRTGCSFKNGNTEYYVQKGLSQEPLSCTDIYSCHREISDHLKERRNARKPILDFVSESFKEIRNHRGNTLIVLSGYPRIDNTTGFPEGDPRWIEFRLYPPPFRVLKRVEIEDRIQEIDRELGDRNGEGKTGLSHVKTTAYLREESGILKEALKEPIVINGRHLIYFPEILFFHSGIMSTSYTYVYDKGKGTQAHMFVGVE